MPASSRAPRSSPSTLAAVLLACVGGPGLLANGLRVDTPAPRLRSPLAPHNGRSPSTLSGAVQEAFGAHTSSEPTHHDVPVVHTLPEHALRELASQFARDGIVHVADFLAPGAFHRVRHEARRAFVPTLQPESADSVAKGRLGCYAPPASWAAQTLESHEVCAVLRRLTGADALAPSDFPVEIRRYPLGASMGWHRDEGLYAEPQIECVFTLDNSSDSETQWETADGAIVSRWMPPNSLLVVKAEGPQHRVTPVTRGDRVMAKFVMTTSPYKLASWYDNLDAYRPAAEDATGGSSSSSR